LCQLVRWHSIGLAVPSEGRQIEATSLAQALAGTTRFSRHEWAAFGISDLAENDFILSGNSYYQPVSVAWLQRGWLAVGVDVEGDADLAEIERHKEKVLFRITTCKNRFQDVSKHIDQNTCFRNLAIR
jgi:hypothetical protein